MSPRLYLLASAIILTACSSAMTPDKMAQIKPAMNAAQVESILGRPAHIDESETAGAKS
jgi:outer membrane protein assembly factor BamE (lipoprotein component of BamABCDE complex)